MTTDHHHTAHASDEGNGHDNGNQDPGHEQIGTVDILHQRIYTLDPHADVTDLHAASAVVEPGTYPVYRDGQSIYWMLTGRLNQRGSHQVGSDMFLLHLHDKPGEQEVRFRSPRFTRHDLTAMLAEPFCTEGPDQRLRFHLPENVFPGD